MFSTAWSEPGAEEVDELETRPDGIGINGKVVALLICIKLNRTIGLPRGFLSLFFEVFLGFGRFISVDLLAA
jgi:hypothetical protein